MNLIAVENVVVDIPSILFFYCLEIFPLFPALFFSPTLNSKAALLIVMISTIFYFIFFVSLYLYYSPDAQTGLLVLVVGIWSLPIMIPLWLLAFSFECVKIHKETINNDYKQ
jgi:hypothetical protein